MLWCDSRAPLSEVRSSSTLPLPQTCATFQSHERRLSHSRHWELPGRGIFAVRRTNNASSTQLGARPCRPREHLSRSHSVRHDLPSTGSGRSIRRAIGADEIGDVTGNRALTRPTERSARGWCLGPCCLSSGTRTFSDLLRRQSSILGSHGAARRPRRARAARRTISQIEHFSGRDCRANSAIRDDLGDVVNLVRLAAALHRTAGTPRRGPLGSEAPGLVRTRLGSPIPPGSLYFCGPTRVRSLCSVRARAISPLRPESNGAYPEPRRSA